jgi:alpha-tubulin suppressor-like RCC1 family protein
VWGLNANGQLCLGNRQDQLVPVVTLTGVVAAAGGDQHSLWLESNGTMVACGQNGDGQLGDGQFTNSTTPVAVRISGVASISSGSEFSEATTADGSVWMWGNNSSGQLGVGTTSSSALPERVSLQSPAVDVFCGGNYPNNGHCLAILSDGTLWAWGNNSAVQLGDGTTTNRSLPVEITPPSGVTFVQVATGGLHSLALDSQGNVWAWGDNAYGELGDNLAEKHSTAPIKVLSGCTMIWTTAHNNLAQ